MSDIIKTLTENSKKLEYVSERLKNLRVMWEATEIANKLKTNKTGFVYDDIEIETVYQDDECTVTYGVFNLVDKVYPTHSHKDSVEYLIVTRGKFAIHFGGGIRIMKRGDCLSLPPNTPHNNIALETNSKIFGFCIPPEKAYLMEELLK